ncbi:hypothetical protein POM88_050058 [Heracleum sosnowskyi]|uniref:Uncharacterized protein n=1 Tax=Heracleum sosnowskyi TaxID=360622 RepID=A0AAD8GZB1_9APIA|nr:hypothetical protein POM88_050058 [Heracleum sosnowskyi]
MNEVSVGKQGNESSKRGGKRTLDIESGSPSQGAKILQVKEAETSTILLPDDEPLSMWLEALKTADATKVDGKDTLVKEAETPMVPLPLNMSDDEPLSMWIEARKTADATSTKQGRSVAPKCTTDCSQDIVIWSSQCNDHILPFAKSSSLWKSIESMQVFRLFPQNPHFKCLFWKKESSREGEAIALMVNFVNAVEMMSTLRPDDPRNTLEDTLEFLHELEDNGFDVDVVRDRVEQLLLTKDKREELEAKAKEGTDQIEQEKVEDLDNHIRLLREELALALSTKAQKDSIVAQLESAVNDINDRIRNVDLEFKALVAAPWQVGDDNSVTYRE